ncbi:hypothetical protein Peur_001370 [Populus x canadensis]
MHRLESKIKLKSESAESWGHGSLPFGLEGMLACMTQSHPSAQSHRSRGHRCTHNGEPTDRNPPSRAKKPAYNQILSKPNFMRETIRSNLPT